MALGKDYQGQDCSLARALELVGERWTMLVLRDAFYGVRRFSDFADHLGIPRAVLTERLQALVDAGVLARQRYQESPPRDEYVLTEVGEELWPALYALSRWGERHATTGKPRRVFRHAGCGRRLDLTGACPACGHFVPAREVETRLGPGAGPARDDAVNRAMAKPHRLLEPLFPA
ncbi:DNA-binding transcriptional regulator, HxlR family [Actinopolymorpha cephalotaxi]|uniref:DNA-binding HxlR family transcriptional regulator n=1 Tax=Actinopolymorpha cephalotaxi TaxID=504797 RepID=A0A1I2K8Z5_9ACTN|nr:helix-turn-helix domain-containing protein [Actinopolymorpha cephalotaxi]NYH85894.1 DNA-binding HxlR family transcriptional regulator [Actinopolymorpha cephalotaxi]SFF62903.1 DNA-binding transcriptional regulator, HxlR family [Actinopolymorpha cephalotaxi]